MAVGLTAATWLLSRVTYSVGVSNSHFYVFDVMTELEESMENKYSIFFNSRPFLEIF